MFIEGERSNIVNNLDEDIINDILCLEKLKIKILFYDEVYNKKYYNFFELSNNTNLLIYNTDLNFDKINIKDKIKIKLKNSPTLIDNFYDSALKKKNIKNYDFYLYYEGYPRPRGYFLAPYWSKRFSLYYFREYFRKDISNNLIFNKTNCEYYLKLRIKD